MAVEQEINDVHESALDREGLIQQIEECIYRRDENGGQHNEPEPLMTAKDWFRCCFTLAYIARFGMFSDAQQAPVTTMQKRMRERRLIEGIPPFWMED